MDIHSLASKSGDSQLVGYSFSDGRLVVELRVPELSDAIIRVLAITHRVFADVSTDTSPPYRTCFVELVAIDQHVDVNQDGIIVPPTEFGSLMRQIRNGFGLAFGLRINDCPYLLRFVGARPLVACTIRDENDVQCVANTHKSR